ncbi:MAG TPA: BON domain-containing protein [Candidatus Binatia bacterium]|nr:BON domain-containing protein [Candidatus Binatia bacterium]
MGKEGRERRGRPGLIIGPTTGDADVQSAPEVRPLRPPPGRRAEVDERIRGAIERRLAAQAALGPSAVEVRVENQRVTLQGTVPDGPARRLAEHIADSVAGGKEVVSRLRVRGRR